MICIVLIFFFIKEISIIFILLLIMINKESDDILNTKRSWMGNRIMNFSMRPKILYCTPSKPIKGNLFSIMYYNKVFDLTYLKIFLGVDKFWIKILKSYKLKDILIRIVYMYFGMSRLLLNLMLEIIKYDKKCLEDYLFGICQNPSDDRIIMRIDGVWVINGANKRIVDEVCQHIIKNNLMSHNKTEQFSHILFNKLDNYRFIKSKMDSYPIVWGNMIDKNRTSHVYVENLTKRDSHLGMLTDYFKAKKMNCYGKDPIINKINIKKETIVLQEKKSNIFIFGEERTVPTLPFLKAAKISGFDKNLVNINFKDKLKMNDDLEGTIDLDLDSLTTLSSDHNKMIREIILAELIKEDISTVYQI
jgi:hypothetical protein